MKITTVFALIFYTVSCLTVSALAQRTQKPITIDDLLATKTFATRFPVDLSPDGQCVAYTLENQSGRERITDKRYLFYSRTGVSIEAVGRSVWVADLRSGKSEKLVEGAYSSWGPSWSPDGRLLAFYSDFGGHAALWVWEKNSGKIRQVSDEIARPIFGYDIPQWTPDGKSVLIKVLPEKMTIEEAANLLYTNPKKTAESTGTSSAVVYTSIHSLDKTDTGVKEPSIENTLNRYLSDLVLINVANGDVRRLASRCTPTAYFLSPDGSNVAYSNLKGIEADNSQVVLYDINVVSDQQPRPYAVATSVRMAYGRSVSWSPDGKSLCYITSGPQANGDCYIVSINGGAPRRLTEGIHPNFGSNYYSQPLWEATGRTIYCIGDKNLWALSIDGQNHRQVTKDLNRDVLEIVAPSGKGRRLSSSDPFVYVCTRDNSSKKVGFYRLDLTTGEPFKLIEEDKAFNFNSRLTFTIDISDDGRNIVYISEDASNCTDLWLTDGNFQSHRRITQINPHLEKYKMGTTKLVEWRAEDGEKLRGTLLLPAGYQEGRRYPVIVDVYGGRPGSELVNRFGLAYRGVSNMQALATRGYAVFVPDMPLRAGTPMRDVAKTVMPGVDKLVELGIADPERLGVIGRSYGGYCVLALLVQTMRFKAAISSAGSGNLFGSYGTMQSDGSPTAIGWAEEGQGRMGGTPWQYRDRYLENSPIFYLDRVTTPLMIVHGAMDETVPAFLSDEIFVGLRRLGKEAVYIKYFAGEHTDDSFNAADSTDYFHRMVNWFDEKLNARSPINPVSGRAGK